MSEDEKLADAGTLTFEAAMTELESIVARLESGDVALEKSIQIYERGEALRTRCDTLLKQAESRVEKISASGEQATGTTPLDVE